MRIIQTFTVPMSLCFLEGQPAFWKVNGHDLHILTAADDDLIEFGHKNAVKTHPIPFRRNKLTPWQDLKSLCQLCQYFEKHKPHIVHGNTPKAALITMIAAWAKSIPVRVYEMHGLPLETANWVEKIIWRCIEKIGCRCATHVIAVSPSLRQVILKNKLVKAEKVSVMHHGSCNGVDAQNTFNPEKVSFKTLQSIRQELKLSKHEPVVGFVGRMNLEKGIQELYEAWQLVKQVHPKAKLLFVGGRDDRESMPKKLFQKLNNDASILCVGQKTNVADYYAIIDFLVLPSYREGFGNVVLEAAAMGKPALVSNVTGLKDAVIGNQTGIFCQPHSVEDLAEKILFYLQNPNMRKQHGLAAQRRAQTNFVPLDIWNAKKALYQHLIAKAKSVTLRHVSPVLQTAD